MLHKLLNTRMYCRLSPSISIAQIHMHCDTKAHEVLSGMASSCFLQNALRTLIRIRSSAAVRWTARWRLATTSSLPPGPSHPPPDPSTPPNPRGTALHGIVLVAAMVLWVSGCCWYGMRCHGLGRAQSGGVVSHGVDTIMVAVLYGMVSHSMWYTICGSGSVSEC